MFEFPLDDIYQMIYSFHEEFALWILIFGVIFGFVLSFVVGANDSANSWGTPVGAGTVSFGVAVLCGSVMELLGAVLLSAGVVRTIAGADSVVNISLYRSDNETEWGHFTVEFETNVHIAHEGSLSRRRPLLVTSALSLMTFVLLTQFHIYLHLITYLA